MDNPILGVAVLQILQSSFNLAHAILLNCECVDSYVDSINCYKFIFTRDLFSMFLRELIIVGIMHGCDIRCLKGQFQFDGWRA